MKFTMTIDTGPHPEETLPELQRLSSKILRDLTKVLRQTGVLGKTEGSVIRDDGKIICRWSLK